MTAWRFTLTVCGHWSWRTTVCCWRYRRRRRSPPGRYGWSWGRAATAPMAPYGSVPGRVCGPGLARPAPARSLRGAQCAVAAPCGRRAMLVRRAGSGGREDPAPTGATPRAGRGLSGRGVALRGYWRHTEGVWGRDSARGGARVVGGSGAGRTQRCRRDWRLPRRAGRSAKPLRVPWPRAGLGRGRGRSEPSNAPRPQHTRTRVPSCWVSPTVSVLMADAVGWKIWKGLGWLCLWP